MNKSTRFLFQPHKFKCMIAHGTWTIDVPLIDNDYGSMVIPHRIFRWCNSFGSPLEQRGDYLLNLTLIWVKTCHFTAVDWISRNLIFSFSLSLLKLSHVPFKEVQRAKTFAFCYSIMTYFITFSQWSCSFLSSLSSRNWHNLSSVNRTGSENVTGSFLISHTSKMKDTMNFPSSIRGKWAQTFW